MLYKLPVPSFEQAKIKFNLLKYCTIALLVIYEEFKSKFKLFVCYVTQTTYLSLHIICPAAVIIYSNFYNIDT